MKKYIGAMLVSMSLAVGNAFAQLAVPPEEDRIMDLASTLSQIQMQSLYDKIDNLDEVTGAQIDIVVVPSLQGERIADYASRVESVWFPEENAIDKHVLFIVSPADKKAYVIAGEGLANVISASDFKSIISLKVIPQLKTGKPVAGVSDGVDAISAKIEEAKVDDITPPLRNVLIKPATIDQATYYIAIIAGIALVLAILVHLGKKMDFTEYLKSKKKRVRRGDRRHPSS